MTSNPLNTQSATGGDIVKYALTLLLAVAGLGAFYWFEDQWQTGVRMLALVAGLLAGAVVFMGTAKGAQVREFVSESRFEMRKVVWPTRQETTRMMWVVIVVVILISLMLAGFDLVIQWAIKWLLGSG